MRISVYTFLYVKFTSCIHLPFTTFFVNVNKREINYYCCWVDKRLHRVIRGVSDNTGSHTFVLLFKQCEKSIGNKDKRNNGGNTKRCSHPASYWSLLKINGFILQLEFPFNFDWMKCFTLHWRIILIYFQIQFKTKWINKVLLVNVEP